MDKRVLIVDDEKDIRAVVQVSLEKFALWQVSLAASGAEALIKAKSECPDAILLDVSMPDMDGFQVWQYLQTDPQTQSIPVVLLTANVSSGDRQRFAKMGIAGVITKPFNPVLVWKQIAEIIHWDR